MVAGSQEAEMALVLSALQPPNWAVALTTVRSAAQPSALLQSKI